MLVITESYSNTVSHLESSKNHGPCEVTYVTQLDETDGSRTSVHRSIIPSVRERNGMSTKVISAHVMSELWQSFKEILFIMAF